MVLVYLPLAAVLALVAVVTLAAVVDPVDRTLSRAAVVVFGRFARDRQTANPDQVAALRGAHIPQTYRLYAARTYLFASVAAFAASLLGVYLVAGVLVFLGNAGEELRSQFPAAVQGLFVESVTALPLGELFAIFVVSGATLGVVAAYATYKVRWLLPSYAAGERARRIDASMERTVAFMYALSRSGMPLSDVLRILARNQAVYGDAAREMAVAVKDVDLYGADVIEALQRLSERSPSDDLSEFAENLASVLQSGRELPSFLKQEYDYYAEEAEANQEQFLELLATLAEAYVTVLVAGPLFLITILVVIGLTIGGTLGFLQLTAFFLIPAATFAFVVYLDSITDAASGGTGDEDGNIDEGLRFQSIPSPATATGGVSGSEATGGSSDLQSDGGVESTGTRAANRERFAVHERLRPILYRLRNPTTVVLEDPTVLFWATVPLAALYLGVQWWGPLTAGVFEATAYDDALVHAALFVLGSFSLAYEIARRRRKAIEAGVPDFLDRFASTNEAGMAAVESFGRTVDGKLGALTQELERTWADVRWGARMENAFERFRDRVATPAVSRVVTLTTNAMSASGDLGPVLRIAADEAKATRRLERDRRNELLTYLVVIYVAFFVFLAIVVALDVIFIPNIPTQSAAPAAEAGNAVDTGPFSQAGQLTDAKKAAYSTVFFHTGLVQAVCSGLVAGQMGEGTVKAGAKHATVMLTIAYGVFLIIG
jgi:flagellar protein FlaJ